jgi:hypothetical protein
MRALRVYLRLYADCLAKALGNIQKNAWTLLLPAAVALAEVLVMGLVAQTGILAGVLGAAALSALFSSYLFFVGDLVESGRVSLRNLQRSVGAYFWSLMNLLFVLWLASLVLGLVASGSAQASAVAQGLWLVAAIALNATPEVIYVRGTYGGVQTLRESWEFLKAEWLPWFAANVPLLLLGYGVWQGLGLALGFIPAILVGGALVHVIMVFRGHLFRALAGSSHRQRMFRHGIG